MGWLPGKLGASGAVGSELERGHRVEAHAELLVRDLVSEKAKAQVRPQCSVMVWFSLASFCIFPSAPRMFIISFPV